MSFTFENTTVFTLREVANSIQKTIVGRYGSAYWIKAEMNKLNHYSYSGHCFPDLVEKNEGKVIAQMRAMIWRSDFERINKKFIEVLKEPLKDGINILFQAQIQFDPIHGMSLKILDIDPSFSLGELEREKAITISRLKEEQIYDRNKNLSLTLIPQRIAIISVETSKGYADFVKILDKNPYQFKFFHTLFPSILQGERAIISIRTQLEKIKKMINHFDVVVIVRGGGGDVGLSAFNHYELARDVALFPLPIFTGIGHATNETVVEMIAHRNAITPTDIANTLIKKLLDFMTFLQNTEQRINNLVQIKLQEEQHRFAESGKLLISLTENLLNQHKNNLNNLSNGVIQNTSFLLKNLEEQQKMALQELSRNSSRYFEDQNRNLENLKEKLTLLDPKNVLKRGFSISYLNGQVLLKTDQIKDGDLVTSQLYSGSFKSIVTEKEQPKIKE